MAFFGLDGHFTLMIWLYIYLQYYKSSPLLSKCSFCRLQHKAETLELSLMFDAAGDEIDACGLDGGMAEDIGESHDVVAAGVERCGKEMTQVMREHFAWCDAAELGEFFHIGPDFIARNGCTTCCEKDLTAGDFLLLGVFQQLAAQLAGDEDGADLTFEVDVGAFVLRGFDGDGAEL